MRYISTRGQAPVLSFEEAMLTGLARDGGLYLPETIPTMDAAQIAAMADALGKADGKVLAYCRSGTRSTFLWSLAQAATMAPAVRVKLFFIFPSPIRTISQIGTLNETYPKAYL